MWEFLQSGAAQLIIWTAVLAMLTVLAIYAVNAWRHRVQQESLSANDLLNDYREMHSRGDLSDEEFRTIKTALKARLEQELGESGNDD